MKVTFLSTVYVIDVRIYFEFIAVLTKNKRSCSVYCDKMGRIFKFLSKSAFFNL